MQRLSERLLPFCETQYADFMRRLVPETRYPIWGVRVPVMRKIAKELAGVPALDEILAHQREAFSVGQPAYEMVMVHLLMIAYAPSDLERLMERVWQSVGFIDNWGLCDSVGATLSKRLVKTEEGRAASRALTVSSQGWASRLGLVTALSLDSAFREAYLAFLVAHKGQLDTSSTAVSMGMAWLLSQYAATHPSAVLDLLKDWPFDPQTRARTVQKMRESHRYDYGELGLNI